MLNIILSTPSMDEPFVESLFFRREVIEKLIKSSINDHKIFYQPVLPIRVFSFSVFFEKEYRRIYQIIDKKFKIRRRSL